MVKMRSEQEMYELIIGTARADERIRAVYINGSRTDKNAPKDIFQDYDIVYAVCEALISTPTLKSGNRPYSMNIK